MVNVGRKPFILCVSEVTLLPVVLEAAGANEEVPARLAAAVAQVPVGVGVGGNAAQAEADAMSEASYATTASRRVLARCTTSGTCSTGTGNREPTSRGWRYGLRRHLAARSGWSHPCGQRWLC